MNSYVEEMVQALDFASIDVNENGSQRVYRCSIYCRGIQRYKGRKNEEKDDAYVMIGLSPSFISDYHFNSKILSDAAECRASFKFKEAFDRYQNDHDHADMNSKMFENTVAHCCGSAPGGWTK